LADWSNIRVKGFGRKWNIVKTSWLHRCFEFDRLLPFTPEDMITSSRETENNANNLF
jgi:hypothetical protein